MASWRSGYAEDCKSLHPGSIPGEASTSILRRAAGYRAARNQGGAIRMALTALERDAAAQRLKMVNGQLRVCDVNDLDLLAAFLDTPREEFVEPEKAPFAYLDGDQPSLGSPTRRLLPPAVLARLLQAAEVKPGERVLDVGGGAGYGAAIFSHLGAQVVALESDAGAAAAARKLLNGRAGIEDGRGRLAAGAKGRGPFDGHCRRGRVRGFARFAARRTRRKRSAGRRRRPRGRAGRGADRTAGERLRAPRAVRPARPVWSRSSGRRDFAF